MRLSAVMVSSWRAGKLSSDRAGASASRPKSLSLDVHLDVTLRAKIHDLTLVAKLGNLVSSNEGREIAGDLI